MGPSSNRGFGPWTARGRAVVATTTRGYPTGTGPKWGPRAKTAPKRPRTVLDCVRGGPWAGSVLLRGRAHAHFACSGPCSTHLASPIWPHLRAVLGPIGHAWHQNQKSAVSRVREHESRLQRHLFPVQPPAFGDFHSWERPKCTPGTLYSAMREEGGRSTLFSKSRLQMVLE